MNTLFMNVNLRNRFIVFGIIIIGLFVVLFIQLIQLTVVMGEEYADMSETLKERTITVSGARGSIFDRNGLPLAYDQKSFNVQFYRDPTKHSETDRAYYTGIIIDTIDIVEKHGGQTIDTFAIRYNEQTGEYYFEWGIKSEENKVLREENWRENMYVGEKRTPEQIYLYLRNKYKIPSEMGYEEARKILSIWQEVQLASWVAYKPIDVAYNVSIATVAEIETHSAELSGMSTEDSTVRIYPRVDVAAHIIGYLGKIVEPEDLKKFQDLGYKVDDLVGVEGVEASMEKYLTGNSTQRQGVKEVEIDNMAVVVNEISSTEPTQGDNLMLTIDIPLQLALEESLAVNIPKIHDEQVRLFGVNEEGDYDDIKDIGDLDLAVSGAAVVLDVDTGEVLAMGSYPSFDLNLFTGGIDYYVYEDLKNNKTETPLFNKAISSRATPGSIFKMVTGLGGLMEGELDLNEQIDDEGPYDKYTKHGRAPRCWTKHPENHQDQTIIEGLEHSCNYFFYTVVDRLGIDRLNKWGDKLGLTALTGIEIPGEVIGQIGNQKILYNNEKSVSDQSSYIAQIVKRSIIKFLKEIGASRDVEYDETLLSDTAEELIRLAGNFEPDALDEDILKDENGISMGDYVRSILFDKLEIPETTSDVNDWDRDITSWLDELRWTPNKTLESGIGQGVVQVTPIAVSRYVAALVNGGTVYETHVVDKIIDQDGKVILDKEPVVYDTLDAKPEYLDAIKQGMADVVNDEEGTAAKYFVDFPEKYKTEIGGKTGTAEVTTIDLENNSWFVCFAPYDKPEIAIVVYVPHGYSGGLSSYVAQDIVEFYLDRKELVAEQTIPDANSLVF